MQVWWRLYKNWNRYRPENNFRSLWDAQGRITLIPIVNNGPKINIFQSLYAGRIKIRSNMKSLSPEHHLPIICLFETKGKITLLWLVWSCQKSMYQTHTRFYVCSHYLHVLWRDDKKQNHYCSEHSFLSLLDTQGQVTYINSRNWAQIEPVQDCMHALIVLLSAPLMKSQSK